jgi:hypothetical protein
MSATKAPHAYKTFFVAVTVAVMALLYRWLEPKT